MTCLRVEFFAGTVLVPALMKNPVSLLRVISLTEGVSYLVLLGIAMPLIPRLGLGVACGILAAWAFLVLATGRRTPTGVAART